MGRPVDLSTGFCSDFAGVLIDEGIVAQENVFTVVKIFGMYRFFVCVLVGIKTKL